MNFRKERLESLLVSKLNEILLREIEVADTLVTITGATISKDLERAEIGISVLPSENTRAVMKILERQKKYFPDAILKKTRLRSIPELIFRIDEGPARAASIEKKMFDEKIGRSD